MNQVIIIGRLTADPELKYTAGKGTALATFTVAVDDRFDNEHTNFFDVTAWGKTAENICNFFVKGKAIGIVGRLKQERWDNKEGQKRSKVGIVLDSFDFIGKKDE